jgi:hypothetical protein
VSLFTHTAADLPAGLQNGISRFHVPSFEDSTQLSILAENEEKLNDYLKGAVEKMAGGLRTMVNLIERTGPLVSYERWREYSVG